MRAAGSVLVALVLAAVVLASAACGGDDQGAAFTAAPIAAVQDDHLPVIPMEELPDRFALLRDLKVTTTRVDLFWADIAPTAPARPRDPDDPAYDWSRADLIMRELAAARITPIVSVYNTPGWATDAPPKDPGVVVNPAFPRAVDFADFMQALVTRYRGDFTPAGTRGSALPEVRRFEIWNEPNLSRFLGPQTAGGRRVGLDHYAAMAKAAYPRMKAANRDVIVIAGVAGPRSSTSDTGTGALDWLRGLRERDIPLDAYSQHIYPASPPTADTSVIPTWNTVPQLLKELEGFSPKLPLYITEAGYTTAATPYRDTEVTEEEQAEYLEQIYSLPRLRTPRIPAIVWFNLQDNADWPGGLLRADGTHKPSYARFAAVVAAQEGAGLDP